MKKEDCFYLGNITRTSGFKGEVVIFLDTDNPENYSGLESVFVEVKGNLIPYFVESVTGRNKNNQLTIKFQDVDSEEQASMITGCGLYLPLDMLPPMKGNAFYYHEIEGWSVSDLVKGSLGVIQKVLDYPGNPLFEIYFQNKLILIPVRDEFIERLDRENKTIFLKAPEGLIDIYLDEE